MWEIGLILAAAIASQPQAATLEGCEFVEQRWICRYRLPEVQLLTSPPTTPSTVATAPATTIPLSPVTTAAVISTDPGVLSEAEISLVARCAESNWMALCLPSQRVEARRLRDQAQAYESARLRIGTLLSENDCEAARVHALSGGYLGLAREVQSLCAETTATTETTVEPPSEDAAAGATEGEDAGPEAAPAETDVAAATEAAS